MSDLEFLKELRKNVVKGRSDITRHEMAVKMIDDWIDEQLAAQHLYAVDLAVCTCSTMPTPNTLQIDPACPVHSPRR